MLNWVFSFVLFLFFLFSFLFFIFSLFSPFLFFYFTTKFSFTLPLVQMFVLWPELQTFVLMFEAVRSFSGVLNVVFSLAQKMFFLLNGTVVVIFLCASMISIRVALHSILGEEIVNVLKETYTMQDPADRMKCAKIFGKCLEYMDEQEHLVSACLYICNHFYLTNVILWALKFFNM